MTTHDRTHDALRRWVNATTASKTPRDATELVLVASGEPDPLWRADKEQVDAFRADELATELQTIAGTHADARGNSIRFFVRWLSLDGRTLVAHSWRTGDGAQSPMDGSAESIVVQMQRLVDNSLRVASEQNTETINALKWMVHSSVQESEALRAELRISREPSEQSESNSSAASEKRGSQTERVVSTLLEAAGKKYIERAFTENAGASSPREQPESD